MFSSAVGFSSATSFFCHDAESPLAPLSAAGFTCTALYSLGKNLGVAEEITRQLAINACLRGDVDAILGRAQALSDIIHVPEGVSTSIPVHLFSDKTAGFNQYTNAAIALTAILLTWVASYHSMDGYHSIAMAIAAVSFALMHMVCAHFLRQAMNKLMLESEVLTQQGLGLAYFAKGDIHGALPRFKKADNLAGRLPGKAQVAGVRLNYDALQAAYEQHGGALNARFRGQVHELQALLGDARYANWCLQDEIQEDQQALRRLKRYVRELQHELDIEIDENAALSEQLDREVDSSVRLRDLLFDRDDHIDRLERRCHRLRMRNIRLADRLAEQDDWRWVPEPLQVAIVGRGYTVWVEEVNNEGDLFQQLHIR
jgi:hypothetical protein